MRRRAAGVALAVAVSSMVVGCDRGADTLDRSALERESLERELELALQPDTTQQVELTDVPEATPEDPTPPPVSTPAQSPRPTPRPTQPTQPTPPRQTQPTAPPPAPAPTPAQPRVVSYPVAAGTTFTVRLDESLSTRSHPTGSTFTATLSEPILAANGTLLIPAGATVQGRVVDSRESGRAGEEAQLAIEFTSISHGGRTYAIAGTALDTPVRLVNRDSRAEQAAKVGGGAAVGAILGRVLGGNTKSTVAGAAIGAAAGTAVAMGTAEVDAVVDAGSPVTIRLSQSVTIERED